MQKLILRTFLFLSLMIFLLPSCSKEEAVTDTASVKPASSPQVKKEEPARPPKKKKILVKNKTGWKILNASSSMSNTRPSKAIDGKPKTFWHTQWRPRSPKHPHHLAIDLGAQNEIHGFSYLTRQDKMMKGIINEYEFYVSNDKTKWGEPVAKGIFEDIKYDRGLQVIYFDNPVKGRYIKFVSLSEIEGLPYACCAEINIVVEQ